MFEDAITLLEHLEDTHQPDIHLYRGQTERFLHHWTDENGTGNLESLYPADYRFITNYKGASQVRIQDIHAARAYGREVRDLFSTALTLRALCDDPAYAWLTEDINEYMAHLTKLAGAADAGKRLIDIARESEDDISNFSMPVFRLFWSLAQHYLIATALTDVTFSPRVAAWFATNRWEPSDPAPVDGTGVIYRFRRPCLEEVLARESKSMTIWARQQNQPRPPDLFFVDIRRIPPRFAGRPYGQQGGSVYGFDQPHVLRKVFESGGCVDIFEFPHSKKTAALGHLRKEIVPEEDPFAAMVDRIKLAINSGKAQLIAMESDANTTGNAKAANYLQRLVFKAKLAINRARFHQHIPLGNNYVGYHYVDIESSGSHGYAHLLVIVNEQIQKVVGYVSSEPLAGSASKLLSKLFMLATWFNGVRVPIDLVPDLDVIENFIERAVFLAEKTLGSGNKTGSSSELDVLLNHLGAAEQAKEALQEAFRLGNIDAAVNLGQLLANESRFEEAVAIWQQAIEQGSADAAHNLATMYFGLDRFGLAEKAYRQALKLGDWEANYNLGALFEAKHDWSRAEYYYRKALEEHGDRRAPNNLGVMLLKQKRPSEAEKYFKLGRTLGDKLAKENLNLLLNGKS